ncbi:hypothetical protein TrVGV298_000745 [Trichoderma virens]|nr:hypothetical protein TrVGV298_000745 [Trichoderma virens]
MGSITRDEDAPTASSHPLKIFDAARRQDRFLYACAPMVRYSKLAFRQTVHKYGVDLCWTPMILAKEFNRNQFARDSDFTISTSGVQPPTIVQFGANVPLELARASTLVAPFASGVDLNCGCPQSWACAETLGAALMNKRELVRDMVIETRQHLERDGWGVRMEQDMENPKGRSNRLVDWVTIHPRTRHTPSTTPIRTEALEILTEKYSRTLPILLSGDIHLPPDLATLTIKEDPPSNTATQQQPRPSTTNLSGFMSARGLLANPALFAGHSACPWETLETFMCNVARCPLPLKLVVHHVQEMCAPGMGDDKSSLLNKKERAKLVDFTNMADLIDFLDEKIEEHTGQKGMRRDL